MPKRQGHSRSAKGNLFDAETAKALAVFKGDLHLGGLTTLNAESAQLLVEGKSQDVYLDKVTTLDAQTAMALAELKGKRMSLGGLTALDAESAKALAEFKGDHLGLGGLTTLDAETARSLAEFKGDILSLGGLTTLDAETARALAVFKGKYLSLSGLTALDAEAAKELAFLPNRDASDPFQNSLTEERLASLVTRYNERSSSLPITPSPTDRTADGAANIGSVRPTKRHASSPVASAATASQSWRMAWLLIPCVSLLLLSYWLSKRRLERKNK